MYYEMMNAINRLTSGHTVEYTVMVLCNIMLDLVGITDEDFAMEVFDVVMSNDRFDLD